MWNESGDLTDFASMEDELDVKIGAGEHSQYLLHQEFQHHTRHDFDRGVVSLPCLDSEVFYVEMTELDPDGQDRTQTSLACKNLQSGRNYIFLEIVEEVTAVKETANVIRN